MNPWLWLSASDARIALTIGMLAALLVVACTFAACRAGAFADAASEREVGR